MPNFDENVVITWDIADPVAKSAQLGQVITAVSENLTGMQAAAATAANGVYDSLGVRAVTGVVLLNAELVITLGLLADLEKAAGAQTLSQAMRSAAGTVLSRAAWEAKNPSIPATGGGGEGVMADYLSQRAAVRRTLFDLGSEQGGGYRDPATGRIVSASTLNAIRDERIASPFGASPGPSGWPPQPSMQAQNSYAPMEGEYNRTREIYSGMAGLVPPSGGPADARGILRQTTDVSTTAAGDNLREFDTIVTQYENDAAVARTTTRQLQQDMGEGWQAVKGEPIRVMTEDLRNYGASLASTKALGKTYADTQAQIQQATEAQAKYRVTDPGAAFPASRQLFQQQEIAIARAAMEKANAAYLTVGGDTGANIAQVEKTKNAYKALNDEVSAAPAEVDKASSAWMRHLGWIMQTIVLMTVLREVFSFIKTAIQDVRDLSDASAKLSFITGATPGAARTSLLGQETQMAQFGVAPKEAGQGAIIARQYGLPAGAEETAAKISLVSSEANDYTQVMKEVGQMVARSNGTFDDQNRVLDLYAVLVQNASLSTTEYLNSMESAIPLARMLGLTVETTAVIIAKTAQDLGLAGDAAAGLFSKVIQRTNIPSVQQELKDKFGISATDPAGRLKGIADYIARAQANNQNDELDAILSLVSAGGGGQSRQDLLRLPQAVKDFYDVVNSAGKQGIQTTGAWDKLFGSVGNTINTQLTVLTTSAQQFINVWANSGPMEEFFKKLTGGIAGVSEYLNQRSAISVGTDAFGALSADEKQRQVAAFNARMGYEAASVAPQYLPGQGAMGQRTVNPNAGALTFNSTDQMKADIASMLPHGWAGDTGTTGVPNLENWAAQQALALTFFQANEAANTTGGMGGGRGRLGLAGGASSSSSLGPVPSLGKAQPPFGEMLFEPKGLDVAAVQARIKELETTFADVDGYAAADAQSFAVMDEKTKAFIATLTGTPDAVQMAVREFTDAMDEAARSAATFGGISTLPENRQGGQWGRLQQDIFAQEAFLQGQANKNNIPYDPKQQIFMVLDPVNNAAYPIIGTLDAFNIEVKKATDAVMQFGGLETLPKGVSGSQLQAAANVWQARIEGAQPDVQSYEKKQEYLFWDEASQSWFKIVTSNEALQRATEDLTKSNNQITGLFNVPAGEEVYVPFSALTAGFVPAGQAGASDTSTMASAGLAQTDAATVQSYAASTQMQASTTMLSAAKSFAATSLAIPGTPYAPSGEPNYGAPPVIPGTPYASSGAPNYGEPSYTPPKSPVIPGTPYAPGGTPNYGGGQPGMATAPVVPITNISMTINNRNTILLDGNKIAESLNTLYYPQLSQLSRGSSLSVGMV